MPDKPWKRWERQGCKDLGGTRTGPRGLALPDCMDVPFFAPEFKYMRKIQLRTDHLEQAKMNAELVHKDWLLGLMDHGGRHKYAVLEWDVFIELYNWKKFGVLGGK